MVKWKLVLSEICINRSVRFIKYIYWFQILRMRLISIMSEQNLILRKHDGEWWKSDYILVERERLEDFFVGLLFLFWRNRPNQEILVYDWLITSHVTQIPGSHWLNTWFVRFLFFCVYCCFCLWKCECVQSTSAVTKVLILPNLYPSLL